MVKIPEGWIETTLKDCVSILGDGLHGTPTYDENGEYFFVNGNNLSDGKIIIKGDTKKVSESEYLKYKKDLNNRTIFVSINGTLGNFATYRNEKIILGKSACYFNVLEENDLNYIKYVIINDDFQKYLVREATGTTIKNASLQQLRNYKFILPPLPEQKAIARVLSAFDDKIELLRAENQTLEEMGQTLFKERFGKYKVGDELPDGWKEYELSELVDTINGYSYKGNELVEKSSEALVTLKSFDRNGGFQTRGFKEFKGNPKSEQEVFVGDLVVAHTDLTQDAEVLGNPAFIVNNGGYERLYITMDLVKVNSKNENITKSFLYFLMRTKEFKGHCVGYSNGTTVLHLSKKAIPEFKIVLPKDLSGLKEKSVSFDLIMRKISHNFSQIDELTETRDQLLPKLMSGEVRVEF